MAQNLGCPLPATVLSVASQSPGTWAPRALAMCAILTSLLPLQLAFTHSRRLTVSVVGLIWLSPLL